jgi:antitoxin (DNA-binding transcriptional repressor) of toxin-antitoxin stability system
VAGRSAQRREVLRALALRPGQRVLDIGSGLGLLALAMAAAVERSGIVCGIDLSETLISISEARCSGPPESATANVASRSYISSMRVVGLKVLKNKLAEYVRLASQGETVLIADRDRVVAELVPPRPGRAEAVADAVLAQLVRSGVVTPALLPPGTRPKTPAPTAKLRDVLAELDSDRADR